MRTPPASEPQIISPKNRPGPGVLVIHSWWGCSPAFREYGKALAEAGYAVALADLYAGKVATTENEARALRKAPRREPMYKTLVRTLGILRAAPATLPGPVGVVGFSMGGHWAVWLAQRPELEIGRTVLYYAARGGSFARSGSAFLAHFADTDPWVSASARKGMERALSKSDCPYRAFDYPGTKHWFAESDRPEFDEQAAARAFARSCAHLGVLT